MKHGRRHDRRRDRASTRSRARSVLATALALCLGVCIAAPHADACQEDPRSPTGRLGETKEAERVDPYTRGATEALDKLGYVSLGPFLVGEKLKSTDI